MAKCDVGKMRDGDPCLEGLGRLFKTQRVIAERFLEGVRGVAFLAFTKKRSRREQWRSSGKGHLILHAAPCLSLETLAVKRNRGEPKRKAIAVLAARWHRGEPFRCLKT